LLLSEVFTIFVSVMWPFSKKKTADLSAELSGILFRNPVGLFLPQGSLIEKSGRLRKQAGFITAVPPKDNLINWISNFKSTFQGEITAVEIVEDITRNFSLAYDFADILIINPDGKEGINAMDISDIVSLLDSLLNLRLCYENYTPVYLRVSEAVTHDELKTILTYCRLAGVDGMVAPPRKVEEIRDLTEGRFPIIAYATTPEDAIKSLKSGAKLVEMQSRIWQLAKLIKELEKGALEQ